MPLEFRAVQLGELVSLKLSNMDRLTQTSKAILGGGSFLKDFAKGLLTKKITYAADTEPVSRETPKTWLNKANPVPPEYAQDFGRVYELYKDDLKPGDLETYSMMESSMFSDTRNRGAEFVFGKEGWRTGLDKGGHAENTIKQYKDNPNLDIKFLKKNKEGKLPIEGAEDVSTPIAALAHTASIIAQHKRNNPQLPLEELYFSLYNSNPKSDTPERRQAFRDYSSQYSQNK